MIKRKIKRPTKIKVEKKCPNCDNPITYTQRANEKSFKIIRCSKCEKKYLSRFDLENDFHLVDEEFLDESFECPWCSEKQNIKFTNLPLVPVVHECSNCDNKIKISRYANTKLGFKRFGNPLTEIKNEISDDLLDEIANCLPEQPWPHGIHKVVAEKLGISNAVVRKSMDELIKRERFNRQFDGIVYVKKESNKS